MKTKTYRESLEELEQIVAAMRDGTIELEQVQEKMKRATELLDACTSMLRELQQTLPNSNAK